MVVVVKWCYHVCKLTIEASIHVCIRLHGTPWSSWNLKSILKGTCTALKPLRKVLHYSLKTANLVVALQCRELLTKWWQSSGKFHSLKYLKIHFVKYCSWRSWINPTIVWLYHTFIFHRSISYQSLPKQTPLLRVNYRHSKKR